MELHICLLGDKRPGYIPHDKAEEALFELKVLNNIDCSYEWIGTDDCIHIDLSKYDCVWAGSGPYLNEENTLVALRFAREHGLPTIGTCSGFKYMLLEYAKHKLNAENYVDYIGINENCSREYHELPIQLNPNSGFSQLYKSEHISEISHCTFEMNMPLLAQTKHDIEFCGQAADGRTVLIAVKNHPFYVASLFLPQIKSNSVLLQAWLQKAMVLKSVFS